ncbi:type I 3-dehydroquinate dehydratase [Kytococcus sp. HMSC28H12]|uniref:type I 3-dehydroquinate dehydratase n=1 Tax=Kytococcus sp. HMSC28H12 TaxID=1581067 RepID=UPI0008A401D6|nr:type I 3-dehydroquinate dehydratase [Kytococcus sp. HMSC28H12]OFS08973.1 hypothetical protein HMPREF3099_09365 [Kytococcus sp. HMSC28H12]
MSSADRATETAPVPRVRVGARSFGPGAPAVAVPVMGSTPEEVLASAARACSGPADLVEWRVDHLAAPVADLLTDLPDLLARLVEALDGVPLLVTYRTAGQGGEGHATPQEYLALVERLADLPGVDLVDVELDHPQRDAALAALRAAGVPRLVSHHDWSGQAPEAELEQQVADLRATGADAVKLATTPADTPAALELLAVLDRVSTSGVPVAMLGMGAAGQVTRLVGPACGGFLTFAHAGAASAPGQLDVHLVAATVEGLCGPGDEPPAP